MAAVLPPILGSAGAPGPAEAPHADGPRDWRAEALALAARAAAARERSAAANLWAQAAALHAAYGSADAAELARRALAFAPGHGPATRVLADVLLRDGAREDARLALLASWRACPGDEAVAEALEPLCEEARDWETLDAILTARVERSRAPERKDVALRLAQVRAARGDHAGQASALEQFAADAAFDPGERARAWLGAAALRAGRLSDPRGAFDCAAAAVRLEPAHAETRAACERFARAAGAERELWSLLDEIAPRLAESPAEEREVRLRAASLAERDPRLRDAAARHLSRVLELSPSDPEALAGLTRIALAAGRWDEAAGLVRARASRAAGAERTALLEKLAELLAARLRDPGGAARACRDALATAPPEQRARLLVRLAELCDLAGDARGRLDALEALPPGERDPRAILASLERLSREAPAPADRARLEIRAARIAEQELGQSALALRALVRAVRACPESSEARRELARVANEVGLAREAIRVLTEVAARLDGESAVDAWREVARAHEAERDLRRAAEAWEQVRRRAHGDDQALSALARAYEELRDPPALASVLAEQRAHGRAGLAAAERLAELLLFDLDLPREAFPLCAEVLERDPGSRAARRVAVALASRIGGRRAFALAERALERAGDQERAAAWGAIGGASGDAEAWRRAARLRRALGDARAAKAAWRAVRAASPEDREAAAALDALLGEEDPAAERAEVAWRALPEGGEALVEALRRCAQLSFAAGDARRALAAWAEIAEARPFDKGALAGLEVLSRAEDAGVAREARAALAAALRRTGDHRGLLAVLQLAAEGAEGAERGELLEELAALHERLGEDDAAARCWSEAAGASPSARSWRAAARSERRRGAWREFARAMAQVAELAETSAERREAWSEVAKVMDTRLGDRDGALASWRRALAEDPDDAEALGELARLLEGAERWGELADVLVRQAVLAERRPDRAAEGAELRLRAARIRQDRAGDPAGALRLYRDVLDRVPGHAEAVGALHALACAGSIEAAQVVEPLHERARDLDRWAEVLEARAAAEGDPQSRAALRVRIAGIRESAFDAARAFDAACLALRDDPDSPDALAAAERLAAGREEDFEKLLEACARRAKRVEAKVAVQRRLARRAASPLVAAAAWSAVLDLAPGDAEALEGLVASHRRAGNVAGLAEALRQRAESLRGSARAECLAELAEAEERRGDLDAAAAALRTWLDVEPESREALARLERVLSAAGRSGEVADVIAREIALADAADSEAAVALRYRLAELRADRGDRDAALDLLEEVFAREPDHPAALERLESMLEATPSDARIAGILLAAHEAARRWDRVAGVLELHAPELPSAGERKALLARLAGVRERHLGNAELAFVALLRAFREDPLDALLRGELARLAAATGQDEELAAALEDAIDRASGPEAADLLAALGALHADRLGQPDRAVDCWVRAWRLDPEAAAALVPRLERLCAAEGRHAELADLLEWRAGREEGAARAELLDRAARIRLDELHEPDRADALWREAVAAQPGHLPALRSLARAAEEKGRVADLVALGEALAAAGMHHEAAETARRALSLERLSPPELDRIAALCTAAGARAERARVAERRASALEEAGDARGAALRWREAADDWEAIAHWDAAAAALDKALAASGDEATFARLRQVHARRGAWSDDARVCLEQAERVAGEPRRAELLAEAARVQEQRLGERELAFFNWCRVLAIAPGDACAAAAAERLAGELDAWDDLAAVWEQVADAAAGPARAAALLAVARLRERMGDGERARAAWAEALRADPAAEEPLERLTASLAAEGRWSDVVAALEAGRDAAGAGRALELQRRIAEISEAPLANPEAALAAWREVRRRDPDDPRALDALERLCSQLGRWEDLDAVFADRAQRATGPRDRAEWLRRSAALRDERLDDVDGALARAEEALALDPRDGAALARLARLYERAGRGAERAAILSRQAEVTADPRERLGLLLAAGEAWTRLGDRANAEAAWREALRLDPENPDALAAVADLHERSRAWFAAIEALRRLAASPRAAGRAADAWFRIGRIELARGDGAAAEVAWRRALEVDGSHVEAIRALRSAREAAGDRAAVARLLEAEARAATAPRERARALAELGAMARRDQQDLEAARRWLEEALAADPDQPEAARSLAEIHVARGEWDLAAPLLERIVANLPPDADRREAARWWHRLGLAAERLGDAERALACQRRARDLDGTSLPVLERLAPLAEAAGALDDALAAHEAVLAHHRDGLTREERAAALVRIAAIEERLSRPLRAISALNEALTADPDHGPARARLVALLEARGDHRAALEHRRRIAAGLPPAERASALAEIAEVCRDRLDDLAGAIEALEAAVRLAPADVALTDALVSAHLRAGHAQRAAAALARLAARPEVRAKPALAARLALALGRLERDRVRDRAAAARAFEDALELDPNLHEALAELEPLLAEERRWRDLERIYTRLLEHLPRTEQTRRARAILWRALEGLYANALGDHDAARTAARVAASIEAGAPVPARG